MLLRAIIFDMDGVVYRAHHAIPGVAKAVSILRKRGILLFFLTNNATRSRASLAKRLRKMGIPAHKSEIGTSAYSAAKYISGKKKNARVFVFGERGLKDEIKAAGLSIADSHPSPDFVVSGLDRHATYEKIRIGADILRSGVPWIACNMDPTFPHAHGKFWPGSGSLAAALASASGCKPDIVVGKPNPEILEPILASCARQKIKKSEIALVGDRLEIDIALANAAGIMSILALSGVATASDAKCARGALKPKFVIKSAALLPKLLGI